MNPSLLLDTVHGIIYLTLFTLVFGPIIYLSILHFKYKKRIFSMWLILLTLAISVLYYGQIFLERKAVNFELNQYDVNKNHVFDENEKSLPGFIYSYQHKYNDAGTGVAIIIGIPLSIAWVSLNIILLYVLICVIVLVNKIRRKIKHSIGK